jgi:hypothetical protein
MRIRLSDNSVRLLIAFAIVLLLTHGVSVLPQQPNLPARQTQVLRDWLALHREFRLVNETDCEDRWRDAVGNEHADSCERLIQQLRNWTKNAATSPFYVSGDFNQDGADDFAAVLTDAHARPRRVRRAIVVVFNGPFEVVTLHKPVFNLKRDSVSSTFLGYGPPRPKPWHLIIGAPETEGRALVWRHGKYILR